MADLDRQEDYWDSRGGGKRFGYPIELSWLAGAGKEARILDYGCGYGRLARVLLESGFENVEGVDISPALVARAREQAPGAQFTVLQDAPRLPHAGGSIDVVLLFAVLTCIPTDAGQQSLIAELHRVLRPGGLLYLSDLCLQDDARNRARYQRFATAYGAYGVFETDDGAVCRHHSPQWLHQLLAAFRPVRSRQVMAETMNGNPITATQLLVARP